MLNRYIVIDDFYGNPDELVQVALESPKETGAPNRDYAGVMSTEYFLGAESRDLFKNLTMEPSINSSTEQNGRIRFTKADDPTKIHIHYDAGKDTKWAGAVYLSKEHPVTDGTCFWKHIRTGLEAAPSTFEELAKHGWSSLEEFRAFLETEGLDESLWKKTLTIPYKYNRLVLYRPWLFHSAGPAFGDTLETSRIVQTLFMGS